MQLLRYDLKQIQYAGICLLIASLACFAIASLLYTQIKNIVIEIQNSNLSADSQVDLLNSYATIYNLCCLGGIVFLLFGAAATIFGLIKKPLDSDKEAKR